MDKLTKEAFKAVWSGNIAKLKFLLDNGVDINAHCKNKRGNDKETLLIEAVKKGHILMVEFLIANGADVLKTSGYICHREALDYTLSGYSKNTTSETQSKIFNIVSKAKNAVMKAKGYTYNYDYGDWEDRRDW